MSRPNEDNSDVLLRSVAYCQLKTELIVQAGDELRKQKLKEFKSQLIGQQSSYVKSNTLSKAATVASLRVSHLLAKHKKPFADGEVIKKAFLWKPVTHYLIHSRIKLKLFLQLKIFNFRVDCHTPHKNDEFDLADQLIEDIINCICFSLQFDESVDVVDISQLSIFVRMVFQDMSIKEELMTILPLKKKTRGEDVYCAFKKYIEEKNIPIYKVVSMTTDGAPSMN
ncbi:DUF4371 domain-containing protein [Trichonephila clavipes]|nr:DUF4371 domain-containing protein [Trichonephila clavipes]